MIKVRSIGRITVHLVFVVTLGLMMISCGSQYQERIFDELEGHYFTQIAKYSIADTNLVLASNPADVVVSYSGEFYISDRYTRSIYVTKPPFDELTQFGRIGMGPNEYARPGLLDVQNNVLFFSDGLQIKNSPIIPGKQSIYGRYIVTKGLSPYDVDDSVMVILNPMQKDKFITRYNLAHDIDSLPQFQTSNEDIHDPDSYSIYRESQFRLIGGGVVIASSGEIFASRSVPYELLVFGRDLSLKANYDLSDFPGIIPWTRRKWQKFNRLTNQREKLEALSDVTMVSDMKIVGSGEQETLLIELWSPEKNSLTYHLVNLKGELVAAFNPTEVLFAVAGNIVYFHKIIEDNSIEGQTKRNISITAYKYLGMKN